MLQAGKDHVLKTQDNLDEESKNKNELLTPVKVWE